MRADRPRGAGVHTPGWSTPSLAPAMVRAAGDQDAKRAAAKNPPRTDDNSRVSLVENKSQGRPQGGGRKPTAKPASAAEAARGSREPFGEHRGVHVGDRLDRDHRVDP
jgi:hypothetical protein